MIYTDNKDFYPTPRDVFDNLTEGARIYGRILEPSAGKGDIIRYIRDSRRHGDPPRIDAIENDPRLVDTLMSAGVSVVWDDFLTYETYKEYDFIIMNPPFSDGVAHVLKALDLAENQLSYCEIFAIVNRETIDNTFSTKRQELIRKLNLYNADIRYVSGAFSDAERKTDVEIALIHVKVPKDGGGKSIYDKIPFFTAREPSDLAAELGTAMSTYVKPTELAERLRDVERLVAEYETAVSLIREAHRTSIAKQSFLRYVSNVNRERSNSLGYVVQTRKAVDSEDLRNEIDKLRSEYWKLILGTDDFRKMLTNDAIAKLNRKLESAGELEINLSNIRTLLMALGANRQDILIDSVVSIFQRITDHHMTSYSSNVHYYNGWRTNSSYKINRKIIIPVKYAAFDRWDFSDDYTRINYEVRAWIDDIIKALQLIDPAVSGKFTAINRGEFENDTLRFKMFSKGTIHVWFKNELLLSRLNYICGSHFGWIPSEGEQRNSSVAREWVAREFGDIGEVRLLQEAT